MKKLFIKIFNFCFRVCSAFINDVWWTTWSNIRWHKQTKLDIRVASEDLVQNKTDIEQLVKKLYNKFTWTEDGLDQLGDSLCPPAYNYQRYLSGELKDDCDGFHSLVYHCLTQSNIECYLLSVVTLTSGHCVLLFKLNGKWSVIDYARVGRGYLTIKEAIETYADEYVVRYKKKHKVLYYGLTIYNYDKHKFQAKNYKKIK